MRLEGRDGSSIQLSVMRYQFPNGDDPFDRNWLVLRGEIHSPGKSWTFNDPCLLTSEARELGSWLRHVTNARAEYERLDFIEPNLAFDVAGRANEALTLRVYFELEARPSRRSTGVVGEHEFWLDLDLENTTLQEASEEWLAELELFPVR